MLNNLGDILLWFVVFLFSLSFHEASHAWTSEKFGDNTGRYQGRITLNPIPHIDPIGTILFPLINFLAGGIALFGWAKPVQTNPLLWRDKKKANICVSAAGPLSNLLLAIIAFVIIKILVMQGIFGPGFRDFIAPSDLQNTWLVPVGKLLGQLLVLNIALAVFNLFPIAPLDGSHILESFLSGDAAIAYEQVRPYGFILLIALMMLGVFRFIFQPIMNLVQYLVFG